jgi:hypothetical protein
MPAKQTSISKSLNEISEYDSTASVVGGTHDTFVSPNGSLMFIFSIDPKLDRSILPMVKSGAKSGLSLTEDAHPLSDGRPLELTLTNAPAREGCHVVAWSKSIENIFAYKRAILNQVIPEVVPRIPREIMSTNEADMKTDAPATEPVAEPSELEKVFNSLPEDARQKIMERMELQEKKVEHMKGKVSEAEKKAKEEEDKRKNADVNSKFMVDYFKDIQDALDEEQLRKLQIHNDQIGDLLTSGDLSKQNMALQRGVRAYSLHMQNARAESAFSGTSLSSSSKRKAGTMDETAPMHDPSETTPSSASGTTNPYANLSTSKNSSLISQMLQNRYDME